jgi:hypothetical protein
MKKDTTHLEMSSELREKLTGLSQKEEKYFRAMYPKSGVLYITAKPGVAKSAIARNIAKVMGYEYIDQRLSMNDETDFKFPYLMDAEHEGKTIKVSGSAIPQWAFDANKKPTIIHFEELNRAPQFVRNAALQILLERQIGDFKFNDDVLMMSSGNLGEEDGTDVEDFDNALKNRLIHFSHTLSKKEWFENFADHNIHPLICGYLDSYPERLSDTPNENSQAYSTPRSWTFLSDWIVCNYGMESGASSFIKQLSESAQGYIGVGATRFIQYCNDMINISIYDVINNYEKVKTELKAYNRDKGEELINSLKGLKLAEFSKPQFENLNKFLKTISEDTLFAYIIFVVDKSKEANVPNVREFLREHYLEELIAINQRTIDQS